MIRQTNLPRKCAVVVVGLARPYQFVFVSGPFTFSRQSQIELGPRRDPLREPAIAWSEKSALLALDPQLVKGMPPIGPTGCAIYLLDDAVHDCKQLVAKMLSAIAAIFKSREESY